jgi:hypothetical protein
MMGAVSRQAKTLDAFRADPRDLLSAVPIRSHEDVADLDAREQAGERRRQHSRRNQPDTLSWATNRTASGRVSSPRPPKLSGLPLSDGDDDGDDAGDQTSGPSWTHHSKARRSSHNDAHNGRVSRYGDGDATNHDVDPSDNSDGSRGFW